MHCGKGKLGRQFFGRADVALPAGRLGTAVRVALPAVWAGAEVALPAVAAATTAATAGLLAPAAAAGAAAATAAAAFGAPAAAAAPSAACCRLREPLCGPAIAWELPGAVAAAATATAAAASSSTSRTAAPASSGGRLSWPATISTGRTIAMQCRPPAGHAPRVAPPATVLHAAARLLPRQPSRHSPRASAIDTGTIRIRFLTCHAAAPRPGLLRPGLAADRCAAALEASKAVRAGL